MRYSSSVIPVKGAGIVTPFAHGCPSLVAPIASDTDCGIWRSGCVLKHAKRAYHFM